MRVSATIVGTDQSILSGIEHIASGRAEVVDVVAADKVNLEIGRRNRHLHGMHTGREGSGSELIDRLKVRFVRVKRAAWRCVADERERRGVLGRDREANFHRVTFVDTPAQVGDPTVASVDTV